MRASRLGSLVSLVSLRSGELRSGSLCSDHFSCSPVKWPCTLRQPVTLRSIVWSVFICLQFLLWGCSPFPSRHSWWGCLSPRSSLQQATGSCECQHKAAANHSCPTLGQILRPHRQLRTLPTPHFFPTPNAFRTWLIAHAATAPELLVGFYKVGSGRPSMSWSESVDEALCFGWIDGVRRRIDDAAYSIRFTPRRVTSIWSALNIAKLEQLQAEGRMTAGGGRGLRAPQGAQVGGLFPQAGAHGRAVAAGAAGVPERCGGLGALRGHAALLQKGDVVLGHVRQEDRDAGVPFGPPTAGLRCGRAVAVSVKAATPAPGFNAKSRFKDMTLTRRELWLAGASAFADLQLSDIATITPPCSHPKSSSPT